MVEMLIILLRRAAYNLRGRCLPGSVTHRPPRFRNTAAHQLGYLCKKTHQLFGVLHHAAAPPGGVKTKRAIQSARV